MTMAMLTVVVRLFAVYVVFAQLNSLAFGLIYWFTAAETPAIITSVSTVLLPTVYIGAAVFLWLFPYLVARSLQRAPNSAPTDVTEVHSMVTGLLVAVGMWALLVEALPFLLQTPLRILLEDAKYQPEAPELARLWGSAVVGMVSIAVIVNAGRLARVLVPTVVPGAPRGGAP
jgi:hypothetical protein